MSQLPPRTVGQSLRRGTSRRLRWGRGSRGKDETPRVPIGCQTTNTVVGDCFFSNLKGVWWVSYDSHGPMTPGATGNKGEIACFENMFCGCLANRSTQTAFVVCFVCHPQQRRMCFGLFRWKMIGCCQRSWSRISWTQAWMTVWIKANQISCLPTEIHHFDSALLGCQWGLWRNFPR